MTDSSPTPSTTEIQQLAKDNNIDITGLDPSQLAQGIQVEQEHGQDKDTDVVKGDPAIALKIAVAHLRELPDYYTKLEAVESESLQAILALIESKTVTIADLNKLIQESLPKSTEERVIRHTRPPRNLHMPHPGRKVDDATDRDSDTSPMKTFRGRRAVAKQGQENKKHASRFHEAVEFLTVNAGKPITECQELIKAYSDKPALGAVILSLLSSSGHSIDRDWLYGVKLAVESSGG